MFDVEEIVRCSQQANATELRAALAVLVEKNFDIVKRANVLSRSLYAACLAGSVECVRLLLGAPGASLRLPCGTGTALHAAASSGNANLVSMLLKRGVDPSSKDLEGRTPAEVASNEQVAALLLPNPTGAEDQPEKKAKKKKKKKGKKAKKKPTPPPLPDEEEEEKEEKPKTPAKSKPEKKPKQEQTVQEPTIDGIPCKQCGKVIERSKSFERLEFKFCSVECVLVHKKTFK